MAQKMLNEMPSDNPPRYLQFVCLYALAHTSRARCWDKKAQYNPDHKHAREYLQKAIEGEYQS